ncbi:MAG: AI-2E family transporter [Sphaerobacteraceae bacterium]|nr:MAG: AI-2E family transporter [Sphaerobacteraceae bacterium]
MSTSEKSNEAQDRKQHVWLDWRTIAASAAALAIAFAIVFIAWMILRPLAILLMSIILAETLEPLVQRFEQRMRRSFAVVLAYLSVVFGVILLALTVVPLVLTEVGDLTETIPEAVDDLTQWVDEQGWVSEDQLTEFFEGQMENGGGGFAEVPLMVVSGLAELTLAVFLSIYWLIGKPGARSLALSMVPPDRRDEAEEISAEVGSTVGGYIRGVVISGAILAVVAFIGLTLIGVDFALPLAMLMFFGELIPIIGPLAALVPAMIVAAFDSMTTLLLVIGLYLVVQFLESSVVYPQVMKRQASIPPILVIFALLAGGSVGGLIGALVAIPLAGAIRVLIIRLAVPRIQKRLGNNQPVEE